jgi:hypothetical protein
MKKPTYRKPSRERPNCWEMMNCSIDVRNRCPAYPDMGRECWKVTGTKCNAGTLEESSLSEKIIYCRGKCAYYKKYIARGHLKRAISKKQKKTH